MTWWKRCNLDSSAWKHGGNVMGGQTAYVKFHGATVEKMLIDLAGGPSGMKMANGENPKRTYGRRRLRLIGLALAGC